ncbi:hypothetical protein [Deinococcus multiflagellatus]|uniref:Uncharacterized protein n=1 Tax=Deinococcus multiflagellatus TaxID=1656887 RepID=A0ABW1ZQC1_9DEIO
MTKREARPQGDLYSVVLEGSVQRVRHGWTREQLTRVGGDLQLGDCVRVTGECDTTGERLDRALGVIVDDYAEAEGPDFRVFVLGQSDAYECPVSQLTRIPKREALA